MTTVQDLQKQFHCCMPLFIALGEGPAFHRGTSYRSSREIRGPTGNHRL